MDFLLKIHLSNNEDIALGDIIVTEVLQGIKDDKEYNEVKKSLLSFPIYSLKGIDSYITAAELYRKCRKKRITIRNTIDLFIAQIILENDLILLHNNDSDFRNIAKICEIKFYKLK